MPNYRLTVDTGGTFSDFVLLNEETGEHRVLKVPSTPDDPGRAILDGLDVLAKDGVKASDIVFFCHGTTVATNALLEEKGATVGLVVTKGFRGIYETQEQSRPYGPAVFDLKYSRPPLLAPGRRTAEVTERIGAEYEGMLSMEINEVDWFMALYEHYLEQGMSEDEVMEIFKGIAANSVMVDGHATQMDQLAAGQYAVAMSTYDYQTAGIAATGAPLDYEPLVEPVVQRPNGVALLNSAPHPAAAYLFYMWILTDGQEVLREAGLRSSLEAEADEGLQGVETLFVDPSELVEQYDHYEQLYAEVTGR
ncbi:hypothetical protein ASD19_00215 [Microbacterium sp. Root53]|uniref:hydantoinase/oxoprolinase N-terminal domain-containing protein n=1 Tax=Microbacterium sp. Root53 TaxID=1736553 RepID=UPI0006F83235|nr:hydantoinase/oxoprolinase N-terminal domain-containing protein [Microbacterium sp. Root53]KQZ11748.1 hypothetical protein ASD19_00215 [Microbacterium sp. Root53]